MKAVPALAHGTFKPYLGPGPNRRQERLGACLHALTLHMLSHAGHAVWGWRQLRHVRRGGVYSLCISSGQQLAPLMPWCNRC